MLRSNAPSQRKRFIPPFRKDNPAQESSVSSDKDSKVPTAKPFQSNFKPPSFKIQSTNDHPTKQDASKSVVRKDVVELQQPLAKKPRISSFHAPAISRPLAKTSTSDNDNLAKDSTKSFDDVEKPPTFYYNVLWRKQTTKKNKTWDGDGILIGCGRTFTLKDLDGKDIGKTNQSYGKLKEGEGITVGGKEVEITGELDPELYNTGRCFLKSAASTLPTITRKPANLPKFKKHAANSAETMSFVQSKAQPRHNPGADNALVLSRPCIRHQQLFNPKRQPVIDVVVDPILSSHLRPHQRDGVQFLYQCVMQMKDYDGQGAILADEMGLGKTIQTIALIWTLLKQTPYFGSGPVIRRGLVVCPATLVQNWAKEFKKWLGDERVRVFPVESKTNVQDFLVGKIYSVMVIGYEKLRTIQDLLKTGGFDIIVCDEGHRLKSPKIKTSLAIKSLPTRKRIILSGTPIQNDLSEYFAMVDFVNPGILGSYATFKTVFEEPIIKSRQPNATREEKELGSKRSEELTRLTSQFVLRRTAEVNNKYLPPKVETVVFCKPSSLQLSLYSSLISSNFFRNTYSNSTSTLSAQNVLVCITYLKKLCNSPSLLFSRLSAPPNSSSDSKSKTSKSENIDDDEVLIDKNDYEANIKMNKGFLEEVLVKHKDYLKEYYQMSKKFQLGLSGKLDALYRLTQTVLTTTSEKIVLVSNYTQTLDILEEMCEILEASYFRLDGSTPTTKRQQYVDYFNKESHPNRVFLLSSKSGGCGLNLIGASRIVLFDIDWNPSVDLQAMARVWRDGQRHQVHIYRFLTTGTIEEKIFQRQLSKQSLSAQVLGDWGASTEASTQFTKEELKRIFQLNIDTNCWVHECLGCECEDGGDESVKEIGMRKKDVKDLTALSEFQHYSTGSFKSNMMESIDLSLNKVLTSEDCNVSFLLQKRVN